MSNSTIEEAIPVSSIVVKPEHLLVSCPDTVAKQSEIVSDDDLTAAGIDLGVADYCLRKHLLTADALKDLVSNVKRGWTDPEMANCALALLEDSHRDRDMRFRHDRETDNGAYDADFVESSVAALLVQKKARRRGPHARN
jgi:hypothetical protein